MRPVTERVQAHQLRPGDMLCSNEGPLVIRDVDRGERLVRLLTNGEWWSCPLTTRFIRRVRSHRIEMRPDLATGPKG